ncbi:MAG: hypothetical protein KF868_12825 [Acidobacteria bacterium]|nr:hypothetical protein [Acidobacteriota bacterium]MCW5970903.1 hypothetical protein [Blastocatellales bacterium]
MNLWKRQAVEKLGAAGLILVLLSGWAAPPLRFALPEASECGMECCLAQGYCSCNMGSSASARRKAADRSHKHHDHSQGEDDFSATGALPGEMAAVQIGSPCQQPCAQIPAGARNFAFNASAAPAYLIALDAIRPISIRAPRLARDALLADSHAPRGPPQSLL